MNLLESLHFIIQSGVAAGYLPSMLQYGFVINALLAGCLLGPLSTGAASQWLSGHALPLLMAAGAALFVWLAWRRGAFQAPAAD